MSKKNPSSPDYRGAAEEQAESAERLNTAQTVANRPDQYTPWGSNTWEQDGDGGWTQTIALSEAEQAALDSQQAVSLGRSDLAAGLIGRTADELSSEFNWDDMPDAGGSVTPNYVGNDLRDWGTAPSSAQGDLGPTGVAPDSAMGDIGPTGVAPDGREYNNQDVQSNLNYDNVQSLDASGAYNPEFGQTQYDRQMSLRGPQMEEDRAGLENRLRNQGLTPGTEAYDGAMNDLREQQGEEMSRMSQDAMRLGANEQQAQYGRELSTRQQQVGETNTQGDFYNSAAGQRLAQELGIGQQEFDQLLTSAGFKEGQRSNRADESSQQFTQDMAGAEFAETQRALRGGEFNDQFGREMSTAQYADSQRTSQAAEDLAVSGQNFDQDMASSNYQNQLRQQGIAEEAMRRGISINEMNALLTGQQVSTPSMPSFNTANRAQEAQLLAAANSQGQFDQASADRAASTLNAVIGASSMG